MTLSMLKISYFLQEAYHPDPVVRLKIFNRYTDYLFINKFYADAFVVSSYSLYVTDINSSFPEPVIPSYFQHSVLKNEPVDAGAEAVGEEGDEEQDNHYRAQPEEP